MKRRVQLYIGGRRVDLGDDSWILFNWMREDLTDPTALVNSSSHQVTIPGTARNNNVLGAIFRLDRRTLFGTRTYGTEFDPTRKTPFHLYDEDGTVLEAGYCRLDNIDTQVRRHAYTLTLFGGLGSFFYSLAYQSDGSALTLADMTWKDLADADVTDFTMSPAPELVQEAWGILADGYDSTASYYARFWNIINFAPAYNGLPEDFDASHAIGNLDAYNNIPYGYTDDNDVYYTYMAGTSAGLLSFTNPHTEWEMGDLRWYLQRPCISVKAFMLAICDSRNNGGYTVTLDSTFFNDDNPYYAQAWWTLPRISPDDRASSECLNNCLAATKSPMEYLTGYAKTFGLLFLWDGAAKTVNIVTRATFYTNVTTDISKRIDRTQLSQKATLAETQWYQMGDGGKGEFVEQYALDYGKGYATQRIDTGYEFDAQTKTITDGIVYADAAEVSESDRLFYGAYGVHAWGTERVFLLPHYETVTIQLWNGSDSVTREVVYMDWYSNQSPSLTADNTAHPGTDWLPKLQLHEAEEKGIEGADVLVFFDGMKTTPSYTADYQKTYYLTGDSADMRALNEGTPCWDITRTGIALTALPSFRRVITAGRYIAASLEWGVPAVRAVPDLVYPVGGEVTIYGQWWKAYLTDRFHTDTRVLTCKVDLRGLRVGQDLLRRFYWIDNALWALNAIRNHSLTSWDLTECEFVKVMDRTAYVGSIGDSYIKIFPYSSSYNLVSGGESQPLTVYSSSAWTASLSSVVSWLTVTPSTGYAGKSGIVVTATANDSGARRMVNVTLTNNDGGTVTFAIVQPAKGDDYINVDPSSLSISASGTGTGTVSRGKVVRVTASSAWALDRTTVPDWLTTDGNVSVSNTGLSIRANANSSAEERTASLKVYLTGDPTIYATVSVSQEAGEGGTGDITLTDGNGNTSYTAAAAGETLTLTLTVPDADSWTITNGTSFATVSPLSGSDNGTITVTIPENTGSSQLSGTITATRDGYSEGAVFYLYQAAPAASSDYIYITRRDNFMENNVNVGNGIEYEGFDITATGAWTASTDASWVHVYGSAWSGSGSSGPFWFKTDANTGAARVATVTATLTATGDEDYFYIYQDGDGTVTMSASFSKTTIDSTAQTIYLTIVGTAGLAWTIDNVSSGLSPESTSGTIGFSGSSSVTVTVTAASAARTLSLRVKNTSYSIYRTVRVSQTAPAASDYLYVSPFGDVNVAASDTSKTFSVQSSTSWQVTSSSSSVSISPSTGSGNATVTVTFPDNTSTSAKVYPLTFVTTSGTVVTVSANIKQPAPSSVSISASPSSVTLSGSGDSSTVSVVSTGSWTASKSQSWISVGTLTGSAGTTSVTISATANTGSARTGTVTFTCGSKTAVVTVSQPSAADLEVSANSVALAATSGDSETITVYASGMWDFSENTSIPIWLNATYTSHAGSENGEALTFTTATENTGSTDNTATLELVLVDNTNVTQTITVTQAGQSTLYVSPSSVYVNAYQGSGTLNVTSNTEWHVSSYSEGLHVGIDSGDGDGVITWWVEGNPSVSGRSLTIVVVTDDGEKTATVAINQAGGMLYFDPDEITIASNGESIDVDLLSSDVWTVDTDTVPSWLTVSPLGGSQIGTVVTFTAAEYAGSTDRTATVTVQNEYGATCTIDVTQKAASSHSLTISPTTVYLSDASAASGSISIVSDTSWTVEVTDTTSAGGVSVGTASGTGNKTVTWSATANSYEYYLHHIVKVKTTDGAIVRTLDIYQPPASGEMISISPDTDSLTFYYTAPESTKTFTIKVLALEDWTAYANGYAPWCVFDTNSGTANTAALVTFTPTISSSDVQTVEWVVETTGGYTRTITITTIPE